jgi:succinyl-diaminopimelate desuccinylase
MSDAIVSLTKKFISLPSYAIDRETCLKILELAQEELKGQTYTSFVKDGIVSLLYTNTPEPTKKCKIILNAHLDVVQGHKEQFNPIEKDGKLYGRGAYDMKAAAATMIHVFKDVAQDLPYTLGLQITTDEEIVGSKGVGYQLEQGVTTEFAITGECGSNLHIINRFRGIYVIKLHATGQKAHAGHLWQGENALLLLYEAINAIMQHYPTPKNPSWQTTVNVAKVETNNIAHNIVPEDATAVLDIRFLPEEKESIIETIKSFLPKSVTLEVEKHMQPHHTQETNSYLQQLVHSIENVTEATPNILPNWGGSDIVFYSTRGIGGVEIGPKGGSHHGNDEWVEIASLETYYQILKDFLLSVK